MIKDWRQMISNEKEFVDDHFLYFFQTDIFTKEDIDEIFSSFSEGDELKKRYWTYQNTFNLIDLSKVSSSNEKLIELIKLDLYENARILKKMQTYQGSFQSNYEIRELIFLFLNYQNDDKSCLIKLYLICLYGQI